MKLDRLPEYLTITVATIFGMGLSLYIGVWTGGGNSTMPMMIVGGIIALVVALFMRADLWIFVPLCWSMGGTIAGMSASFPIRDMVCFYVFVIFLALKALKVVRAKTQYRWLDYLLLFNLLYLATAYIRHPVGTNSMGVELIGGKQYFELIFAVFGYWVIGHVTMSPKLAMKMPLILIAADVFTAIGGFIASVFPITAPILNHIYSGISSGNVDAPDVATDYSDMGRDNYLAFGSQGTLNALYSFYSPFSTLNPLHIWRFLFALVAIAAILKSGFRSALVGVVITFVLSAYFRRGLSSIFKAFAVIVPLLAALVMAQGTLIELPPAMQRTLSFLPGNWEHDAKSDAEGSTEWRQVIWKNVLNPQNRYIVDFWFGDGFGMTRTQLMHSMVWETSSQEALTVAGNYHSLPLTAIHTVGYVGAVSFLILLLGMAVYGWKLISKAQRTPYFPISLFLGVQAVQAPFTTIFLVGDYGNQIVSCVFSIAMLRLISRSLDQYRTEEDTKKAASEPRITFPVAEIDRFPRPALL